MAGDHVAPPGLADVPFQLHAHRPVVPKALQAAVNLARLEEKSAPLAQCDQLVHFHGSFQCSVFSFQQRGRAIHRCETSQFSLRATRRPVGPGAWSGLCVLLFFFPRQRFAPRSHSGERNRPTLRLCGSIGASCSPRLSGEGAGGGWVLVHNVVVFFLPASASLQSRLPGQFPMFWRLLQSRIRVEP